jgi:hypothetical protein
MDEDVAYFMGLLVARGELQEAPNRRVIIRFPFSNLEATGLNKSYDQETSIKLGANAIRERLADLLDTDIQTIENESNVELAGIFLRRSMIWRNLLLLTNGKKTFREFRVPPIFLDTDTPLDWKLQFIRGYGDVAGNVRKANNFRNLWYRVRLDILNYRTNWELPVQICTLLQQHLKIPVQLITWGHPNLGRDFREHQLNISADSYLQIGFSFSHKQKILEELADWNVANAPENRLKPCPGIRKLGKVKGEDSRESDKKHLGSKLVGKHFDSYWQICKALGCEREPSDNEEVAEDFEDLD